MPLGHSAQPGFSFDAIVFQGVAVFQDLEILSGALGPRDPKDFIYLPAAETVAWLLGAASALLRIWKICVC